MKTTKVCGGCGAEYPRTAEYFYERADGISGLRSQCIECFNKARIDNTSKRRLEVLKHYSGQEIKCACCGEKELVFLCIDHINGGGHQHRLSLGIWRLENWLINNGMPEGFRVLCYNCNNAIRFGKICPHQRTK